MATIAMSPEAPDLKTWLAERLRRTNWVAAGIAAVFQLGFFAMLIAMGVVNVMPEPKPALHMVSISMTQEHKAAPPAPDQPREVVKQPPPPVSPIIMPPPKIVVSAAAPVVAAPEKLPDPPKPTATAAPTAPTAVSNVAAEAGPVTVTNLGATLTCSPPKYPAKANFERQEGVAVVQVVLSTEGRITSASLRQSTGFRLLDEAALAGVRTCRGSPTVRNGRAVEVTGPVRVPFKLNKK